MSRLAVARLARRPRLAVATAAATSLRPPFAFSKLRLHKANGRSPEGARPCGLGWNSAQAECYPASLEDEEVKEPEIEGQGAYNPHASRQNIRVLFAHTASHEEVRTCSEQDENNRFHGGADIRGTCIHRSCDSDADSIADPPLFQSAEDVDGF